MIKLQCRKQSRDVAKRRSHFRVTATHARHRRSLRSPASLASNTSSGKAFSSPGLTPSRAAPAAAAGPTPSASSAQIFLQLAGTSPSSPWRRVSFPAPPCAARRDHAPLLPLLLLPLWSLSDLGGGLSRMGTMCPSVVST